MFNYVIVDDGTSPRPSPRPPAAPPAGSRSRPGGDFNFVRHVPKFLQAHAHLLGAAVEEDPEAAALSRKYDLDDSGGSGVPGGKGSGGGKSGGEADDEDDDQQVSRSAGLRLRWKTERGRVQGAGGRGQGVAWRSQAPAVCSPLPPARLRCSLAVPPHPPPLAPWQEALRHAIEQDPTLLQQHPELQRVADAAAAEGLKAQGNAAFQAGKWAEAAALFSRCIELDPRQHIYWSNRSAAHAGLGDWAAAARDARRCTELKPGWAKGWSRLGAACLGLEHHSEVRRGDGGGRLAAGEGTVECAWRQGSSCSSTGRCMQHTQQPFPPLSAIRAIRTIASPPPLPPPLPRHCPPPTPPPTPRRRVRRTSVPASLSPTTLSCRCR